MFKTVSAQVLGREVAVQVITKGDGMLSALRRSDTTNPAAAAQKPAPRQSEEGGSPLEHLISKMQGFDNFKVE